MKRQKLIVEVVEARNLAAKDGQGFSSPYVAVDFYGQRKRTRTAVRDLSPTWNESLEFNAVKPSEIFEDVLELSVFHDKTFGPTRRNTFLGRLRLCTSQFVDKGEEALVYLPLQKKHLFTWVQGDIGLRIYFAPDAEPEPESKSVPPPEGQSTGEAGVPEPAPENLVQPGPEPQSKSVPPPEEQSIGDPKPTAKDVVEPETVPEPHVESVPLPEGQNSSGAVDPEPKPMPQRYDEAEPPGNGAQHLDTMAASVISKPPPPMVPEIKSMGQPMNTTLQPIRRRISRDESESGERTERSTFDLVEKMHYVFVRVVKARSLSADHQGNPTVKISIGNHHVKSRPATRTAPSPFFEWDQIFAFSSSCGHDVVEVSVWDCESFLGGVCFDAAEVPVRDPPDSPLAPQWYRLEGCGAHPRGDLMLATWAGTQADDSFSDAWKTGTALDPAVYHSPKLWYLRVSVLEAQGLVPGSPESFFRVRARLGAQVARTKPVAAQNGAPAWNEDLVFVAAEPFDDDDVVTITLETGKGSSAIKATVVPLCTVERRVDDRRVASRWYSLAGGGSVHLRVCFDGGYHVADEAAHASSDYRPSARQLWNPPVGSLDLGIVSFRGFIPDKTAAYCLAKYGPKWVRTRTVSDGLLDPRWNEQYGFDVFDPCTVLTLAVFDSEDSPMGKVRIRISTLSAGKVHRSTYALAAGTKRTGELDVALRFSRTAPSAIDLLRVYSQPALPAMHYLKPLSGQLEGLRLAAARAVAEHLSVRSEPPLRRESVLYVLLGDPSAESFSMSRVRENYARIVRSAAPLIEAARWLDETRRWKSSAATVLVHALLVLFVWFPDLVIPTAAFYVSAAVTLNFRRRHRRRDPRSPAVENPSSSEEDSYERLRAVGARVQAGLGEAAVQGERVRALLTWRDPRATGVFVVVCFAVGAVMCLVPPKMAAVALGFYYLRHPIFRDRTPSPAFNFFRRLPVDYSDSHPITIMK